jgi:hypothetical protein
MNAVKECNIQPQARAEIAGDLQGFLSAAFSGLGG